MDWNLTRYRLGAVLRVVLGGIWAWAAWSKLEDPRQFLRAVRAYDATPEWLSKFIAYGLPMLELILAVLLILGLLTRIAAGISAVLFASIVYFPTAKLMILPIPVPIPAPLFAVCYLAYSWWSAKQNTGRINHDAHLGGAISGLVFVAIFDPNAFGRALAFITGSG